MRNRGEAKATGCDHHFCPLAAVADSMPYVPKDFMCLCLFVIVKKVPQIQ